MTKNPPAPELTAWLEERVTLLEQLIRRAKTAQKRQDDDQRWTLDLIDQLAGVETTARRAVHLLTAHALRHGVATATEVSKVSDITISAVMSRSGSKLSQEVWNEIYPSSR
jgi:predicted nucleic acid-binding protein